MKGFDKTSPNHGACKGEKGGGGDGTSQLTYFPSVKKGTANKGEEEVFSPPLPKKKKKRSLTRPKKTGKHFIKKEDLLFSIVGVELGEEKSSEGGPICQEPPPPHPLQGVQKFPLLPSLSPWGGKENSVPLPGAGQRREPSH